MTKRKAAAVGPGNEAFDAHAARLRASLSKEERKPAKRAKSDDVERPRAKPTPKAKATLAANRRRAA